MVLSGTIVKFISFLLLQILVVADDKSITYEQTSSQPNTLFDDADDIQRQLDNEARDRIKYGRPKTIWIYNYPMSYPGANTVTMPIPRVLSKLSNNKRTLKKKKPNSQLKEWNYNNQKEWDKQYPDCAGQSQTPVDLPASGTVKTRGCRRLGYINYEVPPRNLVLHNDGRRYVLYGEWDENQQPVVYGGAAHSRRYIFHSLTLHWPSEHRIGGLQFPFETQVLHISPEYTSLRAAVEASPHDPQAFLGIVNLYKFSNRTQHGLVDILKAAATSKLRGVNASVPVNALNHFSPSITEYACYQGSLPVPPCTESVLWLVRARSLPIARESLELAYSLMDEGELRGARLRQPHPLNDRKVFYINS